MTPQHQSILREINSTMELLMESGLADDQNPPYIKRSGKNTYIIRYSNRVPFSSSPKQASYQENYWEQRHSRAFNFLMLDGAMIQMEYEFNSGNLVRHRLAFLPSPDLLEYQNNPELYTEEVLYADVVDKGAVTVPLRFDYDAQPAVTLSHPQSHMTLGQYTRCRIPVTAGVTPHSFMDFLLRSFYNTASSFISLPNPISRFNPCIADPERQVIHVGIPTYLPRKRT